MPRILEVLVLLLAVYECDGARILAFYASPMQSHMNLKSSLLRELVARGHHVTAVTPFPEKTPMSNYDEILIPGALPALQKMGTGNNYDLKNYGILNKPFRFANICYSLCKHVLNEPQVQALIHAKELHFDLIISEAFFSDCFLPFSHKFEAPTVKFSTFGGAVWMFDWVGNPNSYSYVPDVFLEYSDKMTLSERTWNTISGTLLKVVRRFYHLPRMNQLLRNVFNGTEQLPSIWELEDTTTSLLLLNNHFSISYPRPLLPNVVEVGGLHVKPPQKLPKDIENFLNNSAHGAVFFSMGSILESSNLPQSTQKAFLEAFSKMKENILWKWEAETLPGQPNNVKLGKWLPQSDILAHPKVRAFITHGGLLSSQEALDRGVPVVGIPVFGDQKLNVERAKAAGFGVMLDFGNITTESVFWALREILDNPKYRENAQRISRIYHDQPLRPLEQAVFWTEYVIRHKGAPHMRSAALDLIWYQYFLLDVITVLMIAVLFILLMLFIIINAILRRFRGVTSRNVASFGKKNK